MIAVACSVPAPGDTSDDTATDTSDLKAAKECGGFVAHPKKCPSGYTCIANKIPDLPGTCHENACIENVLCVMGDHFDTHLCRCVPNPT